MKKIFKEREKWMNPKDLDEVLGTYCIAVALFCTFAMKNVQLGMTCSV